MRERREGQKKEQDLRQKKRQKRERLLSIAAALVLWQILSMAVGQKIILVSPITAAVRLGELAREGDFWLTVGFSFLRIEAGFFLGLILGSVLAVAAAGVPLLETMLWPYMTAVKSVPVASFIILCLIWLDRSGLSVFISFLMVLPIFYFNVLSGMKSADRKLLEMAEVFRISRFKRFCYLYLPQVRPFLFSACSAALGISWKAGVAAEVIGIPDGSIGERLYEAKVYLDTAELFAWTAVVVFTSVLFEKAFMGLLKRAFERLERL